MNQKKAKAIRRQMRELHGRTKSLNTVILKLPIIKIFTASKYRREFKIRFNQKAAKLRAMGVTISVALIAKRVAAELPEIGTRYKVPEVLRKQSQADEPRTLYQAEKKRYQSLPKKLRRTV